jgi:hypothetical protein
MYLFILTLFFLAPGARANFVSYVDENGTKHFVQSETEIPAKYRAKAKISTAGNPENSHVESGPGTATSTADSTKTATLIAPDAPLSVQPTGLIPSPLPSGPPSSK